MRNNQKRLGAPHMPQPAGNSPAAVAAPLAYVVPTEFVELPSKGHFYPPEHPLHGQETIEIKYMTAKEEDILSSETLLKKGLVIDRLLSSIITNQEVDPRDMLLGDRNAIMIAARISSYGQGYEATTWCDNCNKKSNHLYDLKKVTLKHDCFDEQFLQKWEVEPSTTDGPEDYVITLPKSQVKVGVTLMTGHDELDAVQNRENKSETFVTDTLARLLVSVNGYSDENIVKEFVQSMPASDSRYLRKLYSDLTPNVDLTQPFVCTHCGSEQDKEVPLSANFFWPEQ